MTHGFFHFDYQSVCVCAFFLPLSLLSKHAYVCRTSPYNSFDRTHAVIVFFSSSPSVVDIVVVVQFIAVASSFSSVAACAHISLFINKMVSPNEIVSLLY